MEDIQAKNIQIIHWPSLEQYFFRAFYIKLLSIKRISSFCYFNFGDIFWKKTSQPRINGLKRYWKSCVSPSHFGIKKSSKAHWQKILEIAAINLNLLMKILGRNYLCHWKATSYNEICVIIDRLTLEKFVNKFYNGISIERIPVMI